MVERAKNYLAEAFDLKFIIQIATMVFIMGVAWANVTTSISQLNKEIERLQKEKVNNWDHQTSYNDKNSADHLKLENQYYDVMKKLDILIVELQNGKYTVTRKVK